MSLYVKILSGATIEALVSSANTFLATLSSPTIRRVSLSAEVQARRSGAMYQMAISYETPGQVVLGSPWLLRVDVGSSAAAAEASAQAFIGANPAYFFNGAQIRLDGSRSLHVDQYKIITLYCEDGQAVYDYGEVPISTTTTAPVVEASDITGLVVTGLGYSIVVPGCSSLELQFQLLTPTPGDSVVLSFSGASLGTPLAVTALSGPAFVDNLDGTWTVTFATGSETAHCRIDWSGSGSAGVINYTSQLGASSVSGTIPFST